MEAADVDTALLLRLWRLATTSRFHVDGMFMELADVGSAQFLLLRAVTSAGGACMPSKLARDLKCTRPNVVQLVDRLKRYGFLERRIDNRHTRCRPLWLTRLGERAVHSCEPQLPVEAGRVFEALDENEKAQLLALLQKLKEL